MRTPKYKADHCKTPYYNRSYGMGRVPSCCFGIVSVTHSRRLIAPYDIAVRPMIFRVAEKLGPQKK
jgi:hypothetical protein